jgi:hypothetical protein
MKYLDFRSLANEPSPILQRLTPLEASKIQQGRESLETSFLYFERLNKQGADSLYKPDFTYLKKTEINLLMEY